MALDVTRAKLQLHLELDGDLITLGIQYLQGVQDPYYFQLKDLCWHGWVIPW